MKLRNFSIISLVTSAAFLALAAVPAFAESKPTAAASVASDQSLVAQAAPASMSGCKCCADMKKKMEADMKKKMEAEMGKMPVVPG